MLYAAIDIHKRSFQAAVLDSESGEISEQRFGASREEPLGDVSPRRRRGGGD
jgi:hypothetical protein